MASLAETLKRQVQAARAEYKAKRRELEKALEQLDRDYAFVLYNGVKIGTARVSSALAYGGVREAVLSAISASKGIKPKDIIAKTGLGSQQVHNSLTGLKKAKLVRVKDGLYTAS